MKLMKLIGQLFLIMAVTLSGIASASSLQMQVATMDSDSAMSSHAHHQQSAFDSATMDHSSHQMANSCCTFDCQCNAISCTAASVIISTVAEQALAVILIESVILDNSILPPAQQTSLYRPPIFS